MRRIVQGGDSAIGARRGMMLPRLSLACLLLALPTGVLADTPGTIRLSPEERTAAINAAAERSDDGPDSGAPPRRIHGEMGMAIGSNGMHALYGTTVVPLGQTGIASFSFMTGQSGRWRR